MLEALVNLLLGDRRGFYKTHERFIMDGLTPTFDIGGSHSGGIAGPTAGAAAGALFGSWIGNGWGGNGWGGHNGGAAPVVDSAIIDSINNVASSVNNGNLALAQGFGGLNGVIEGSASATQMTVMQSGNNVGQSIAGLNSVVQNGNFGIQSAMCQGFSGLNTSILTTGKDNQLLSCQSTNAITSAIDNCCCTTQKTIMAESCATRELMKDIQTQGLRDQLCDAKSTIAKAETINAINATTDAKINAATNTIIAHVQAICARGTA